jgi:hypothetical protein
MEILEVLKNKKTELESTFSKNQLESIKPSKLLKLLIIEINNFNNVFTLKEINEFINLVFNQNIKYSYFHQFFKKYCKTKSKNRSNKNVKSESKKDGPKKEVVSNEDTESSDETNIKNDSASVSKKDTNVNEDEEFDEDALFKSLENNANIKAYKANIEANKK